MLNTWWRWCTEHSTVRQDRETKKLKKETARNQRDKAGDRNIQSETDTVKQREQAVNEECSNAGGHWHPLAGTLACQVVGFTLEPLGFAVKRLSRLEGPYSWLQPGSHCLGHWRGGNAGWMEGKQEEDREEEARGRAASGSREHSQHVEKRWVSRMLLHTEGLEGIHQLTHWCTWMYKAVIGISPPYLLRCIIPNKTDINC